MRFFILTLLVFLYLCNAGLASASVLLSQSFTLHSDNKNLTSRINISNTPFSAGVDTAQMLVNTIGYEGPVLEVSLKRSFNQIDNGKPVCVINKIKSDERAKKYAYSLPLNFFQTQRLFQLSALPPLSANLLDENGAVISISDVLNTYKTSAIVLPETYSFGARVDADLHNADPQQKITLSNATFFTRFMDLFSAKRAEFALIYPASLYRQFGNNMSVDARSYSISGNPEFVSGHVICGKSPAALKFIEKVNVAIKSIYANPKFIQAHTQYLPSQSRVLIEQAIKERTKHHL